uniref:Aminoacyl-transfer RNA synthetases class-II family profile domain-containing protein n=1 Tax=Aureoumbra lagunensis TaxID=44058 RepID=A0A7S3NDW3_9STRA
MAPTECPVQYMDPNLLPKSYKATLTKKDALRAGMAIRRFMEDRLSKDLNIVKSPGPLAFEASCRVNDDLDGSEAHKAVGFHIMNIARDRGVIKKTQEKEKFGMDAEVVQSLANWKRIMLKFFDFQVGEGLFCESTSIRKGYKGDVTHSNIADQWDWEIRIDESMYNVEFLKSTVRKIWCILKDCEAMIARDFCIQPSLPPSIHFTDPEELHAMWPGASIHERETNAVRKWGAIFIIGMGWPLKDGSAPEEVRSPSYDNWNLNGDIIVRHPVTGYRHELSSMGIRVNASTLKAQLEHRGMTELESKPYHSAILNNQLPLSIGGGIGISRLLMLLLQTGHIGEVQVGVWHDAHHAQAKSQAGIELIPDRILPGFFA